MWSLVLGLDTRDRFSKGSVENVFADVTANWCRSLEVVTKIDHDEERVDLFRLEQRQNIAATAGRHELCYSFLEPRLPEQVTHCRLGLVTSFRNIFCRSLSGSEQISSSFVPRLLSFDVVVWWFASMKPRTVDLGFNRQRGRWSNWRSLRF